jgi:hypothetical protein
MAIKYLPTYNWLKSLVYQTSLAMGTGHVGRWTDKPKNICPGQDAEIAGVAGAWADRQIFLRTIYIYISPSYS